VRRLATAAAAGLLFGVGLVVSGMADPRNVIGFLDIGGHWNPALLAVMAGAIGVHASLLRLFGPGGGRRPANGIARGIDRALVSGSAIFGVGWALAGYCPGPAVVALGFGSGGALAFVAALLAGAVIAEAALAVKSGLTLDARAAAHSRSPRQS
jgi:uncharacterized membrane protein YedE/YeeE